MLDVCKLHSRTNINNAIREDESVVIKKLLDQLSLPIAHEALTKEYAQKLVHHLRNDVKPSLMETFLSKYGLSTDEGIALMCLAEALLRVPDGFTAEELIEDKIASSEWDKHLGQSSSSLVNAATWGLMLTGKVLSNNEQKRITKKVKPLVKRLGAPTIRVAVKMAMKELGHQFVLGESISSAVKRGQANVKAGFGYSYDMLGEAALTQHDAERYFAEYKKAIEHLLKLSTSSDIHQNAGISIKLSALHPRYESINKERVLEELTPKVLELAQLAKSGNLGLNIDAEESDRLDLSLEVIQDVLSDVSLEGWDGFGVVVQAYNKAAPHVLDWLFELSTRLARKITVRLVKGAYWDAEVKKAQVNGVKNFPVYTSKAATDTSYLYCAKKLLDMRHVIYPQFATHNACTVAAILQMTDDNNGFEFQRLHGMGESLYRYLVSKELIKCRIYAPVGKHRDLLAYLVRRLLENGANSSFVNQIVDKSVPVSQVTQYPLTQVQVPKTSVIAMPEAIFGEHRKNSKGFDLFQPIDQDAFNELRYHFSNTQWQATPLVKHDVSHKPSFEVVNPANHNDAIGSVVFADESDVLRAIDSARIWKEQGVRSRGAILNRAADLLEQNSGEIFAILCREAGKNAFDAVAEIREAVDFLRYYAAEAINQKASKPCGIFACVSPWNFPLAIFIGQVAAALASGNAVVAKPAETTTISAWFASKLLYQAGVPRDVFQLVPGEGATVGNTLTASPKIDGVCFTGSTLTAQRINRNMAEHCAPDAPLIAETGGLNCMIVDSTALLEQAVKDVVRSAFQSAGQRCSALRMLYIQEDIYASFISMLRGAINELKVADPWHLDTDIGPVISEQALNTISTYINDNADNIVVSFEGEVPNDGYFIPPTVIETSGIDALETEIFGPVLHVAKFKAKHIGQIVERVNASGYGLTFGIHSRIDSRVEKLVSSLNVGNIYVNRDQVGAIVGSQPFGGENLSGTGPKAGGPHYLSKFIKSESTMLNLASHDIGKETLAFDVVQNMINSLGQTHNRHILNETTMPGPTGELNVLREFGKGVILCLGEHFDEAVRQSQAVKQAGAIPLIICKGAKGANAIDGTLPANDLTKLSGFYGVAIHCEKNRLREIRKALSLREGAILSLTTSPEDVQKCCTFERHVCINTTAAGGNASLLAIAC